MKKNKNKKIKKKEKWKCFFGFTPMIKDFYLI